ncbi:MAG: 50S ribosomal protein L3 [Planctomycetota bacterium]|nr:MAG: 50S ribosomal protein L3 [Planctomycetota bacterium]
MEASLLGTKIGMTQVIGDHGVVEPVTVVKAGPCVVMQVKTKETDGYDAVQIGYEDVKPHRSTKPLIGHAAKAGTGPKRVLREVRLSEPADVTRGDVLTVKQFAESEVRYVDVIGTTKGKGFAGVMKRHGFGGKEASHGVERKHRSAGSIGGSATGGTGRSVKKGKRMAGHMGCERRTVQGLRLVKVDPEADLLLIRGSVPGPNGSVVLVRAAKKKKG